MPETGAHCNLDLSLREARRLVHDLFEPRPWIYWADFLGSIGVGYAAFGGLRRAVLAAQENPWWWLAAAAVYATAVIALYRAVLFTHELVHLKSATFRAFRVAWDLLCGIPLLIPSFTYYTHLDHHIRRHYATKHDGEYLPLGCGPRREIVLFLLQPFVVPLLAVFRFLVLSPLAWSSRRMRRFVQKHASSMVIDPTYVRPLPSREDLRAWRIQEAACFAFLVAVIALLYVGRLPWDLPVRAYAIAVGVLLLNAIRTLGAHRYRHAGEEVTMVEQLLDSVNYPRRPLLSELWAPVGLRFHALHHLFPSLPYHNLATAHRRLMQGLPPNSVYLQTECDSLWTALRELWQAAGQPRPAVRESAFTPGRELVA